MRETSAVTNTGGPSGMNFSLVIHVYVYFLIAIEASSIFANAKNFQASATRYRIQNTPDTSTRSQPFTGKKIVAKRSENTGGPSDNTLQIIVQVSVLLSSWKKQKRVRANFSCDNSCLLT